MKIQVAVSRMELDGKLERGDPRWGALNRSFENLSLYAYELGDKIRTGHAYTCWHRDGWRCGENFLSAQVIPVDMDTEDSRSAFGTLARNDWVRMYGGLLHTTCSHLPDKPRARILFFLDQPIDNPQRYKTAAEFVAAQFNGVDPSSFSLCQAFFGSKHCDIMLMDRVLPLAHLRLYYHRWSKLQPRINGRSKGRAHRAYSGAGLTTDAQIARLVEPVERAQPGTRNNTLYRQACLAGKDIAADRISESEVFDRLVRAGLSAGLGPSEVESTVRRGIARGAGRTP